jgi:hypothetical protein
MDWDDSIKENGFAISRELLSNEYLDHLLDEVNRSAPQRSRAGMRNALSLASVDTLTRNQILLDRVRPILGPEAFPFRATLFDKSPTSNWLVIWHQDKALPLQERIELPGWGPWSMKEGVKYAHAPAAILSQVIALRVHLDDSTADNGPLRVLPRTHMLGVLSADRIHKLATGIVPIDCLAPKGGVVAMRPLVVHASSKSHIAVPRRVLHIEYAASPSIASPLQLAMA